MTTDSVHDLLAEHPFFADLHPTYVDVVAGCGSLVRFATGARMRAEGDLADVFFVVRSGLVALEVNAAGRPPLVIQTRGAGDVVGVSWLFPPHRWGFDTIALADTEAVAVDAACLRARCEDDPRLGHLLVTRFARLLRDELHATRIQLLDVYRHGAGS